MVHVTYAWYIRRSAITFQTNSYLSINITYTSPQLHNKLSIVQKSKIQEILLQCRSVIVDIPVVKNPNSKLGFCHGTPRPHAPQPSPIISDSVRLHSGVTLMHTV